MRRIQSKFIPALQHFAGKSFSLPGKEPIFHFSLVTHPKPCSTTPALLFSNANFNTLVDQEAPSVHQMSSRQRKIHERSKLEDAFESAETTEEMLKAFENMQNSFDEMGLGLACLKLGLKLDQEGEDPEKALSFANRALKVLDKDDKLSLPLAITLQLLGSVCFSLTKFSDSLGYLKSVVQRTDKDSEDRAMIFISLAKALCSQEKFPDSKRCLEISLGILEKKVASSPVVVAEAFIEISMQYEAMNEFETAISLLKRALAMVEKIPEEQHSVGSVSARIGWLLLLTGKVEQAIPYLEDAAERLKESLGSKHYGVGLCL